MKDTLLNKYLAGDTSTVEERKLKELLLSIPYDELTSEETAVLQILTYEPNAGEEEDIFSVDYSDEYDRATKSRRNVKVWYWIAAACMAGVLFLYLMPPKNAEDGTGERLIAEVKPDSTDGEAPQLQQALSVENPPAQKPQHISIRKSDTMIARVEPPAEDHSQAEDVPAGDAPQEATAIPDASTMGLAQAEPSMTAQEPQTTIITPTAPERLAYTPEEIEALKAKAKEKYLEWIQLEQEIINADLRRYAEAK